MTCIVGIETNDNVFIGADSASVSGGQIERTHLTKVFQRGDFLIGYTTSFRMGQLLQYSLDAPTQEVEDDLEYMATVFIDAVRECLKSGGFATVDSDQERGGFFLVGYKGKLYEVDDDYQVNRFRDGFSALGAGNEYAMGSLFTTVHVPDPVARVTAALQAAERFSASVCEPFVINNLNGACNGDCDGTH